MYYSPEHIETNINEYEAKGGYSVAKLLELQRSDSGEATMTGGGATGGGATLMDKIRDLHIPIGLVSRRYLPKDSRHTDRNDDCDVTCLGAHIFEELESMIFRKDNRDTRKNIKSTVLSKTKKRRL